jgi:hypothetical protein
MLTVEEGEINVEEIVENYCCLMQSGTCSRERLRNISFF